MANEVTNSWIKPSGRRIELAEYLTPLNMAEIRLTNVLSTDGAVFHSSDAPSCTNISDDAIDGILFALSEFDALLGYRAMDDNGEVEGYGEIHEITLDGADAYMVVLHFRDTFHSFITTDLFTAVLAPELFTAATAGDTQWKLKINELL